MPLVMDPSGQPMMAPDDPSMGGGPPMGPPPGPPPEAAPPDPTAGATAEDWINVAIEAAKKAAEADDTDAIETSDVMQIVAKLHALLGKRQKEQDAAMGGGPATNFLKRQYSQGG